MTREHERRKGSSLLLINVWLIALWSNPSYGMQVNRELTQVDVDTTEVAELVSELENLRVSDTKSYDGLLTATALGVQMYLGKIGFGTGAFSGTVDPGTRQALRLFETARGLPITGNLLTVKTLALIFAEAEALTSAERAPAASQKLFGTSGWDDGSVAVTGTWITEGGDSPYYEVARIECFKSGMRCEIIFARIGRSDNRLSIDQEVYDLVLWDGVEIMSKTLDYPCARYLLRLNRVQQSAVVTRTALSTTDLCAHMTPQTMITRIATWEESKALSDTGALYTTLYRLGPNALALIENSRN